MGYIDHRVVIITGDDPDAWGDDVLPVIEEFRDSLPEHQQRLLTGPAPGANYYVSYALLPHGHKEWAADGWDQIRDRLVGLAWANDFNVVHLKFGVDDDITQVVYTSDEEVAPLVRPPGSRPPNPDGLVHWRDALIQIDDLIRGYVAGPERSVEMLQTIRQLIIDGHLDEWHKDLLAVLERVIGGELVGDEVLIIEGMRQCLLGADLRETVGRGFGSANRAQPGDQDESGHQPTPQN